MPPSPLPLGNAPQPTRPAHGPNRFFGREIKASWVFPLLKGFVLLLLLWTLYGQLFEQRRLALLVSAFCDSVSWQNVHLAILCLCLMPVNWLLEARKWRELQSHIAPIGSGEAWRGVLAGLTVSLFTPNRMGDYAGKLLISQRDGQRVELLLGALLSNFSQLAAILLCGTLGGLCWALQQADTWALPTLVALCGAAGILLAVVLAVYFRVDRAYTLLQGLPFVGKWAQRHLAGLGRFDRPAMARALWLSVLRYGTYSLQYYLLLCFFGIGLPAHTVFPAISVIYLLQTGIPLPPLTALVARGGIALMVWGPYAENELSILSATYGLWLVNVIFPALLGALYIFRAGEKNSQN